MYSRAQNDARDAIDARDARASGRASSSRSGTSRAGFSRAPSSIRTNNTVRPGSSSSTIRPPEKHRPRRTRAFPPVEYSDLTRNDLAVLAPIFVPQRPEESRSAYEREIKARIAALPAHLHCKYPLLSPFCHLHSKVATLPVSSLFNTIREEIEDHLPRVWGPLAKRGQLSSQKEEMLEIVTHLAVLWLGPKLFEARFQRQPRRALVKLKPSKCNACQLVLIGKDFPTLVAMAGLFIGRVKKSVWGSSKRIQFLLEWTASRLSARMREDGSELVWDIGRKFRVTRIGAMAGQKKKKGKRARVDDDAEDVDAGNVEDEEEGEFGPGTASYAFSLDRELREEKSRGPRKLIGSSAFATADGQEEDLEQLWVDRLVVQHRAAWNLQVQEEEEEQRQQGGGNRQKRAASSMYSRDISDERDRPPAIDINQELDRIISMYQSGDAQDQSSSAAAQQEYPVLNPYAKDEEFNDSEEALSYKPVTTKSRIQSTMNKAFGGKWDPEEDKWNFF
jgi:hypothetical protein